VRLFLAAEPSAAVRRVLTARIAEWRERLPRARWVAAGRLHLTFLFCGETPAGAVPELVSSLARELASSRAIAARLVGVGGFPLRGPVRVLWLGIEPEGPLAELADRARAAAAAAGVDCDPKPFRPHLTLARCLPVWPARTRELLHELAPEAPLELVIDRLQLVESTLAPGGARHRTLANFELGSGPV
jgi:RNA 2',3'-cyclic 3'-phosphodiesterase